MPDLFDRLETRVPQTRESILFRDLRHILTVAKSRVPALRAQLKGFDVAMLATRADLARIPIVRRRDLEALQVDAPPFGGTCATRPGAMKQIIVGDGLMAAPEGQAKDWWGAARALYAAGLRKGSVVVNAFSYDWGAQGHIVASGAYALGCPVMPLAGAPMSVKVRAIARIKPRFFSGTAEHLKSLLDYAGEHEVDVSSIKHALVMGPLGAGLRNEFHLRGVAVTRAFATAELGLVAYESGTPDGFTLNEGLILELVVPGGAALVEPGEAGEMVVTRLNADYPLLRFGTGAISAILPHPSACGRTNTRIRAPVEHAAEGAEFCGMRLHSEHIVEIARRHPNLGRLRLVVRRAKEQDVLILRAEHRGDEASMSESLTETLHKITQIRGTIEFVTPGSLPDDEGVIVDERPLN
ncbi:phenylacetate--CoA ligase family protein [Beijerinckia sp. L45]|uniref:phenylacetate--CoA ligase family protein n=1 Tax=Beijerinckia sp. L45 TaxID=1641855 RepID=UPI00131CDB2F|nr:phenylacetate--CoA ligase family protein [Beijerinckia sp. L45]